MGAEVNVLNLTEVMYQLRVKIVFVVKLKNIAIKSRTRWRCPLSLLLLATTRPGQHNKRRKRKKMYKNWRVGVKEKLPLFADNMIVYRKTIN